MPTSLLLPVKEKPQHLKAAQQRLFTQLNKTQHRYHAEPLQQKRMAASDQADDGNFPGYP